MKIGNKVKLKNVYNNYYDIVTLVGLTDVGASVKYNNIPGVFVFSRKLVSRIDEKRGFSKKNPHPI